MGEVKLSRDLFLWCMSAIYLFAFASLYHQIPGLYGDNGILPAKLVLKGHKSLSQAMEERPTVLWFAPSVGLDTERMMELITLGGILISFICLISHRSRDITAFTLMWVFYFSLYQVGQTFLWFQWDILLLEAGFLAILVAPLNLFKWRSVSYYPHDTINLWLVKWLLFRLMFASGVVKLTSLCPTWWGLTALQYHFESQCIPTPVSWFAHHLPNWFLKLGVVATFLIEIPIPFLFFSPVRSLRVFSFYSQVLLQVMIILTGNYTFFNLLTLTLCISLIDDDYLLQFFGRSIESGTKPVSPIIQLIRRIFELLVYVSLIYWTIALFSIRLRPDLSIDSNIAFSTREFHQCLEKVLEFTIWIGILGLLCTIARCVYRSLIVEKGFTRKLRSTAGSLLFGSLALWIFSISLIPHSTIDKEVHSRIWPILHHWHNQVDKYQLVNSYGLFRRMTGVDGRPEVIIEGTNALTETWKEYEFFYKPGDLTRSPPFVAPHQPRLDWQMWFAALGTYSSNPWFINFVHKLLQNQAEVLSLIEYNPFPDKPPKYIRATLYNYFYTPFSPRKNNNWWTRKKVGEYLPVITKDNPSVIEYLKNAGLLEEKSTKLASTNKFLVGLLEGARVHVSSISPIIFVWSLMITSIVISVIGNRGGCSTKQVDKQ